MRTQFDFNAYGSPEDGKYFVDGFEYFIGEDFRSVKRYKEYKNVGFTLLCIEKRNTYCGEEWESSSAKKCMDAAYEAGCDKILLADKRINDLIGSKKCLIGQDGHFQTEQDLLDYLNDCLNTYRYHNGFYGLQLFDEPHWWMLKSYGIIIKALKQLVPDIYLQCNLLNMVGPERTAENEKDTIRAYEWYLNAFLDESGMDCLMYDDYPFRREYIICGLSIRNYQIAADICKKRDVEFRTVLQSFNWAQQGTFIMRRIGEKDMRWQSNMAMGIGCREFSFYTYAPCAGMSLKEGCFDGLDGSTMLNRDGTRSKLYYTTKKIIAEMKAFAPVILQYKYENNYIFFEEGKEAKDYEQTEHAMINDGCPISVKPDKGVVFVTQLRSKQGALYMIENIGNIKDELYGGEPQKVKIGLGNAHVLAVYRRGKKVARKIVNGCFTEKLYVGDAIFMEIRE